eukprot:778842-Pelagomonas_calceolata.AAC.1
MDNMLTKNTLEVVRVNLGSGTYSSSKLLSLRHVIQGCQNLEGIVCTEKRVPESHDTRFTRIRPSVKKCDC